MNIVLPKTDVKNFFMHKNVHKIDLQIQRFFYAQKCCKFLKVGCSKPTLRPEGERLSLKNSRNRFAHSKCVVIIKCTRSLDS